MTFEDDFVDARGKHLFYEATYIPHFDDGGEVLGYFAFINDITERKQAEEERRRAQRLTALGNMAGGIAHNLNNLLVPIQALFGSFEQPVVKVMSNGTVEERPVVLGNNDDFYAVVEMGVAEAELVVMQIEQATTDQSGFRQAFRRFGGGRGGWSGR